MAPYGGSRPFTGVCWHMSGAPNGQVGYQWPGASLAFKVWGWFTGHRELFLGLLSQPPIGRFGGVLLVALDVLQITQGKGQCGNRGSEPNRPKAWP